MCEVALTYKTTFAQMSRWSLRNLMLKFKTSVKSSVILGEFRGCASNQWRKTWKLSTCNRLHLETHLGSQPIMLKTLPRHRFLQLGSKGHKRHVFNIEVFNTCQMPFWPSKKAFSFRALHKNVLCKVSTSHSEGLSQNCSSQNTMTAIYK